MRAKTISHENITINHLLCPDPDAARVMEAKLEEARRSGDSLGGIVEIIVKRMPSGSGRTGV